MGVYAHDCPKLSQDLNDPRSVVALVSLPLVRLSREIMDLRPVRRSATQTNRQASPAIHGLTARVGAGLPNAAAMVDMTSWWVRCSAQDKARIAHLAVREPNAHLGHIVGPHVAATAHGVPRQTAVQHPKQSGRAAAEIAGPQMTVGLTTTRPPGKPSTALGTPPSRRGAWSARTPTCRAVPQTRWTRRWAGQPFCPRPRRCSRE